VSVIQISKDEFDAGSILRREAVSINADTKFSELQKTLSELGGEILSDIFETD
jgi:methionyl-tRNA formyltransferase